MSPDVVEGKVTILLGLAVVSNMTQTLDTLPAV